jgi:hypothetical protein
MNWKSFNFDFIKMSKKEFMDTIILYTTTLLITLGMVYLLFPNFVKGLTDVSTIRTNVSTIDQKIDSVKTGQNLLHEKVDVIIENQYNFTGSTLDSIRLLNQKIDILQNATYQNNRLVNQNSRDLQTLKQLYYERQLNDNNGNKVSSLEGLFRKQ